MADKKKVVINLPNTLYNEINEIIKKDSQKRSEFFREAIILYIEERKKQIKMDEMKKGYIEMANINRDYAEQGFEQDVKDLKNYEAMLSESDFPNDTRDSKRGDIFYADLSPVVGSEQGGIRPVIVIQNNIGNKYSPTVIIAAITSQINKAKLPTHVEISSEDYGLNKDSVVLLEQIRTLDKRRLKEKIGHMIDEDMKKVDTAILVSMALN